MKFFKTIARLIINVLRGNVREAFNSFKILTALYAFALHFFKSSQKKQSDKIAVFYMDDGKKDRYVFSVINTYKIAGYDVFLKPKYSFYSSCNGLYILNIFTYLKVTFLFSLKIVKQYNYKVFISDIPNIKQPEGFDKYLTIDYKLAFKNYEFTLPFPFHPLIYIDNNLTDESKLGCYLQPLRKANREIKIIFGGVIFGENYNNVNTHFNEMLNRNDIFKQLFKTFPQKINITTELKDKFPITIIDTSNSYIIQHKDWMRFIKQASFFIAPPGFEMPFSHNVIEAMACGLIPIIQYNSYFTPKLENKKNCLTFDSLKNLEDIIIYALSMSEGEIETMKMNVIDYYTQNLSPTSFVNRIEQNNKTNITISIISGIFSI